MCILHPKQLTGVRFDIQFDGFLHWVRGLPPLCQFGSGASFSGPVPFLMKDNARHAGKEGVDGPDGCRQPSALL